MSFGSLFDMFLCFTFGKCSVNRPHASKLVEKHASELAKENK